MSIFSHSGRVPPNAEQGRGQSARFEDFCVTGPRKQPGGRGPSGEPKPGQPGAGNNPNAPDVTTLAVGEEDGGGPIPVEPDGGIGDGAGPIPFPPEATTLAIGEEDGGGGGPFPSDPDDPILTTLAIGEEDGGGGMAQGGPIMGTQGNDALSGTNADDNIFARGGNDSITTGQGNDRVNAGSGDDFIAVTGIGNKRIDGGRGHDTLQLKGTEADYQVSESRGATIYASQDGSEISVRNVEAVEYTGAVGPVDPPTDGGFTADLDLAPNDLGATSLVISDGAAVLSGPGTDFTFTGVDASGIAADGPIIATGGSGTINGEETTAVPLSPFGPAVLTIGSGFNATGSQPVDAQFANGAVLDTEVLRNAV